MTEFFMSLPVVRGMAVVDVLLVLVALPRLVWAIRRRQRFSVWLASLTLIFSAFGFVGNLLVAGRPCGLNRDYVDQIDILCPGEQGDMEVVIGEQGVFQVGYRVHQASGWRQTARLWRFRFDILTGRQRFIAPRLVPTTEGVAL